ncbi:uncharacterized protein [Coffea arabica]|uniref:Uncharacterized protein n=1 Tax=Coffea arabica TaxID=13443 RepID=A0A6P6WTH4_COFAR|nr:gelsolin-related protein of 125 kDa-like [Coffea arabica]
MSLSRHLLRRAPPPAASLNPLFHLRNAFSTTTTHHVDHQRNHEFLPPDKYLSSWKAPKDPKEAQAKLAMLRREYGKKVKAVRKEYIREMEFQKLEKLKKDEAKKEALRIASEQRKAAKEAEKKAKAKEREVAEEEFRQTLLKERAEKLEYWRMRTKQVEEKVEEKNELLRRQSSVWINEADLEKKILEAIVDGTPL